MVNTEASTLVPPDAGSIMLVPSARVTAPKVSEVSIELRPRYCSMPPRRVMGAFGLMRWLIKSLSLPPWFSMRRLA